MNQCNLPPWEEIERAFRGIFERRYFANGGPLVRELDKRFAEFAGTEHAVAVTNETVAVMILAKALDLHGEAIVPALCPAYVPQALRWAGLRPVFCDVDPQTLMLSAETVKHELTSRTAAIVGYHAFGVSCASDDLLELGQTLNIPLLFDASAASGCLDAKGNSIGAFGAGAVFSLNASSILNGAEGACITTSSAALASKFRTTRNFYVPAERVPLRINGKMAEAPAALALLAIAHFERYRDDNRERYETYRAELSGLAGMHVLAYEERARNNYQSVAVLFDGPAPANVAGAHPPFHQHLASLKPNAAEIARRALLLPNRQDMTRADVLAVCNQLQAAVR